MSESSNLKALTDMLAYRRPAGSKTERKFIRDHIEPLGVLRDPYGNLYRRIGEAPIAWSCHTDTVHDKGGLQRLMYQDGFIRVADKQSNCLGADDTAGIWLMAEMITANVPGLYLFHRAEEIGGKGSRHIATETPQLLDGMKAVIALDRYGTDSVITHQGTRCCSDTFADSLAAALGLAYQKDDTGLFTDSANYTDIVGECTNLSVGYYHHHSAKECLDLSHLLKLRDALIALDWTRLTFDRKPGDWDEADYIYTKDYSTSGAHIHWERMYPGGDEQKRFSEIVSDYPAEVADILLDYGFDAKSLMEEIYQRGGVVKHWRGL